MPAAGQEAPLSWLPRGAAPLAAGRQPPAGESPAPICLHQQAHPCQQGLQVRICSQCAPQGMRLQSRPTCRGCCPQQLQGRAAERHQPPTHPAQSHGLVPRAAGAAAAWCPACASRSAASWPAGSRAGGQGRHEGEAQWVTGGSGRKRGGHMRAARDVPRDARGEPRDRAQPGEWTMCRRACQPASQAQLVSQAAAHSPPARAPRPGAAAPLPPHAPALPAGPWHRPATAPQPSA